MKINKKLLLFITSCIELAWIEIKLKYNRSILGPFWIVMSSMILIGGLSFVFNALWGLDIKKVIPWISIGIIIWSFIATIVDEGTQMFVNDIFNNLSIKPSKWCLINVFKNFIILAHNFIIIIGVLYFCEVELTLNILWVFYGLVVLFINSFCFSILLGFLCTRFRDFILIIRNLMFLIFLITPVFWMPDLLKTNRAILADWNIFFQFIQTIRDPLIGNLPNKFNLLYTSSFTLFFLYLTFFIYRKYEKKINLWI